jgi:hypothetical protein
MIQNATKRYCLNITAGISAVQHDKNSCVVARVVRRDPTVVTVVIGVCSAKITFTNGKTVRYAVPQELRDGIKNFDKTGNWALPAGRYYLEIPKKAVKKRTGRKRIYIRSKRYNNAMLNPRYMEFQRRKRVAA